MLTDARTRTPRRLGMARSGCAGTVRPSSFATRRSSAPAERSSVPGSSTGSSRSRKSRASQIDRPRSTAQIRYAAGKLGMADLLQRLADAIRGTAGARGRAAARRCCSLRTCPSRSFTIHRHRGVLTTWEVTRDQPGLLCVRHMTRCARAGAGAADRPARSSRSTGCERQRSAL